MNEPVDSVKTEREAERLLPERLDQRSSRPFENSRNVRDNIYSDSTLVRLRESSSDEFARITKKMPV